MMRFRTKVFKQALEASEIIPYLERDGPAVFLLIINMLTLSINDRAAITGKG